MTTELFGFTLSSETDLGGITGIIAIFVSGFTLAFSIWQWRKTRKSVQNDTASYVMNGINSSYREIKKFLSSDRYYALEISDVTKYIGLLEDFEREISHFDYLRTSREIHDRGILLQYKGRILSVLKNVQKEDTNFRSHTKGIMEKDEPKKFEDSRKKLDLHKQQIESFTSTWTKVT